MTEHIQDVAEDYTRGRVYIPREDMARFACEEADLAHRNRKAGAGRVRGRRARALLRRARRSRGTLPPRPARRSPGFVAGGRATLDAIEARVRRVAHQPRRSRGAFADDSPER